MLFHYFALALYPNTNAKQIVLPILHSDFSSYFGKLGVILKDFEIIFSTYDYYDSKKRDRSAAHAKTFGFSDPTQATKCIA